MSAQCFFYHLKKGIAIFLLLFLTQNLAAQQKKYDVLINRIDSLTAAGLPKSALKEVEKLDILSWQTHNAPQQIRVAVYRMNLQTYLEENALVAIINRLKLDIKQSEFPVKPVLQSILAEIYWNYEQQNRYQFAQRSTLEKPDADFTKWDLKTIVREVGNLYRQSLQNPEQAQKTPVAVLEGVLQGDKNTRNLRPTLYDLLAQRALDFYLAEEPELIKPRLAFSLNDPRLFAGNTIFINLKLAKTDTSSTTYQGVKLLQQASKFHLQKQHPEALADLDLKRLSFLYRKASFPQKDSLYINALEKVNRDFQNKPIAADALVLLAQYFQQKDSLVLAVEYLQKAIKTYPESLGGKNAVLLLQHINQQSLSAEIENVNLPDEPILAKLNYKNLQKATASVCKLSDEQLSEVRKLQQYNYGGNQINFNLKIWAYLQKLKAVQQQQISLPDVKDYRQHAAEFKIDALKPGFYVLLLAGENLRDSSLIGLSGFQVTSLAYVGRQNPNESLEIKTVDRKTGTLIHGVKIKVTNTQENTIVGDGKSDNSGKFIFQTIRNNGLQINLSIPGDCYSSNDSFYGAHSFENSTSREQTILFTDRQLYRPGQTIYFKGLQIATQNNKSSIVKDKETEVELNDNNGKKLNSVKVKSNEFGTFSGSFVLPRAMLNGNVTIETDDGEINVKVEEYKRPTFQISFDAVKEAYRPGDSVKLKGKVLAFAGFGLAGASVKVNVKLSQVKVIKRLNSDQYKSADVVDPIDFISDTIKTNAKGEFLIRFKSVSYPHIELFSFYNIQAEVTNASGETHVNSVQVNVDTQPLKINLEFPQKLKITDSLKFNASLVNRNNKLQKGDLSVKVFSLKKPDDQITKSRLWEKPDQFLWTKDQFKKLFPTYAWQNEDQFSSWQKDKQVFTADLKTDSSRFTMLDLAALKQQSSGVYRVEIAAKNSMGDTISQVKYVQLITEKNQSQTMQDWAIPLITNVVPGGKAVFLIGTGKESTVLIEVMDGEKMISSEWLKTGKEVIRKEITVPLSALKNFRVQLLMVQDNRVYNITQQINIIQKIEPLNIRLLSFRNKLQPGEKEQWKLQVSGNEKQSVEMLAAMYDASLDDLAPAPNWQQQTSWINQNYNSNYFGWNTYNFISKTASTKLFFRSDYFDPLTRNYEVLNLLGFSYYGGNNWAYQQLANLQRTNAIWAQTNRDNYLKSVAAYKNGFDVSGRVTDAKDKSGLEAVTVKIKGSEISVYTDISGRFKLHVPENAVLTISYLGYISQEIKVVKGVSQSIKLKSSGNNLNEIVVVGYGTQAKRNLSGAVANIRINEAVGNSSLKEVEVEESNAVMAYSSSNVANAKIQIRGNNSLQGKVAGLAVINADQIQTAGQNPIQTRKNFNETAFFYPQLKTNEKGEILINFTIPEVLTKWQFKALAQTPDLKLAYLEKEVVTQKQLMVSANMPRFFREGDTITVSAIVANLDAKKVVVKTALQLFNALNMQPVKLLANASEGNQTLEIEANTNKAVSFKLIIPAGLDALTYRLTADAGKYSDGEENTIPVLPNAMLVTEAVPMMVRPNQTKTFTLDKLLRNQSSTLQSKTLTLEYTENPAWYAVQSLPYLMEYPYECSEQTFSRYFANSLATSLVKKLPVIQQVFERWKSANSAELLSNLEKNQDLKSVLIEEAPWLRDAQNESEQKKRIALLFDLNKMSYELQLNLDKLKQMQLADGSFPWFTGLSADRYITQYIMAGIGQLYAAKAVDDQNSTLKNISDKALNYLDLELVKPRDAVFTGKKLVPDNLSSIEIYGWYARSYFAQKPMSEGLNLAWKKYQQKAIAEFPQKSVYEKGLIALTFQHFKLIKEAQQIVKSLIETSQQSEEMGMYWPANQLGYFWYQNPIETQSLLIELFAEAGNTKKVEEMKIWLLRNKQTNNWKTTTATAQACYALLLRGENWLQPQGKTMLFLGGKNLADLKPDLKADAGTGYLKTSWQNEQIKSEMGKVEVENHSNVISWGALYWQYLEKLDKISAAQNSISLERKYFIRSKNDGGEVLTAVDEKHQPKVGDLLKIVVYLKADRDFEYVHLKDMRPAGTEPVDVLSGYKFQDGLYYYQVTKDVATNFFISYLRKGNYVFEYDLRVAQPGNFSTGISSVQSMYAPEFGAHSEGKRLVFTK